MIGAIAGDIIGSIYEWHNIKTKSFPLFQPESRFTDDSVLTCAVARAILNGGAREDYLTSIRAIGRMYPDCGYGGHFIDWLKSDSAEPYNSWGNGSAMRVSPVIWAYDSLEEVLRAAKISSEVTHNHPDGIKGAQAIASAGFLARTGYAKSEIKNYISSQFGYDLDRTLDEIRPVYGFEVSCPGSVPEAIIAFLESGDFESAIRGAISIGGDSDTIAAMTGALAEAAYGVPYIIRREAFSRLPLILKGIVEEFESKYQGHA